MAFNILDIIATGGIKDPNTSVNASFANADVKLNSSFLDAINSATKTVADTNCADNIVNNTISAAADYVNENLKFKNIVKNVGIIGTYGTIDNNLVNFICFVVNSNFKTLTAFIDSILKVLVNILNKIDKLITKVDQALLSFSNELRNCFIRMVLDAKFGLNKIIASVNLEGLLDLFTQCPCIMSIIQEKFTKCKNLTTPQDVITCLNTEYELSPQNILNALDTWTKKTLLDNINFGFNIVDETIQNLLETLIFPLRELVKQYCKALSKKHNVNFLLAADPSIRCLFEYTIEHDSNGNKYYGMSVINMLDTMKGWSSCIDVSCSALSASVKLKVQDYNEKLRLDFQYWQNETIVDIYFACIASTIDSQNIRATAIREIYAKNKGKGILMQIIDFYKDIGKFTVTASSVTTPVDLGTAVTKVLDKTNAQEDDDISPIVDGQTLFKPNVEPQILSVYQNLCVEIQTDTYYRKILELGRWDFQFKKSNNYINVKEQLESDFQASPIVSSRPNIATTSSNTSIRTVDSDSYTSPKISKLNTYSISNDYLEYDFSNKPTTPPAQGLTGLYSVWFANS